MLDTIKNIGRAIMWIGVLGWPVIAGLIIAVMVLPSWWALGIFILSCAVNYLWLIKYVIPDMRF